MKVLSICWYKILPAKFGGQKGIAGFNDALSKHLPLKLLCSSNNSEEASYQVINQLPVSKKQFFNPLAWQKILRICRMQKITHVIFEHPYYGFLIWWMKNFTRYKIIVHSHNVEFLRYKEIGKPGWKMLKRIEKSAYRNADLILIKTNFDKNVAVDTFNAEENKFMIVPYGLMKAKDDQYSIFNAQCSSVSNNEAHVILFAGTLDYLPNAKAVENIYKKIAPCLGEKYVVRICGRNRFKEFQYLNELVHARVINEGEVDDISRYFSKASLFINPVTMHTGTQTKVIEAIASGLNVVIFKSQEAGLDKAMQTGKIFSVNDGDWEGFVQAIHEGIATKKETPQWFYEYYDWSRIIPPVVERLKGL